MKMPKHHLIFVVGSIVVFTTILISCRQTAISPNTRVKEEPFLKLVPVEAARALAVKFNPNIYYNSSNPSNHSPFRSHLNGANEIESEITINDKYGIPGFYIFNYAHRQGFLIVAADSGINPVLAFIERGRFEKDTVPSGLIGWGNKIMHDIEMIRTGKYDNRKAGTLAWQSFTQINSVKSTTGSNTKSFTMEVGLRPPPDSCVNQGYTFTKGPLLPVTWGQLCSYNELCPNLGCNSCNSNAATGCVATAMAQVIRYNAPTGPNTFNYQAMPADYGNSEVQRLMQYAGSFVNMTYGCPENGGSGAHMSDIPSALYYFGIYNGTYSSSYSYGDVLTDITNNNVSMVGGCNDATNIFLGIWYQYQNCHVWLCEGYNHVIYTSCVGGIPYTSESIDFYINWGWHELYGNDDYNGWFTQGIWQPGNGSNFQYAQEMITGIH